jgi:hypothetical protein
MALYGTEMAIKAVLSTVGELSLTEGVHRFLTVGKPGTEEQCLLKLTQKWNSSSEMGMWTSCHMDPNPQL